MLLYCKQVKTKVRKTMGIGFQELRHGYHEYRKLFSSIHALFYNWLSAFIPNAYYMFFLMHINFFSSNFWRFSASLWQIYIIKDKKIVCAKVATIYDICILITSQPAKSLKSNTGGGSFCWISIQYAMPYSQKYTPPYCVFCKFADWVVRFIEMPSL